MIEVKVGDLAVSRKYGTLVTIRKVFDNEVVCCDWFNKCDEPHRDNFLIKDLIFEKGESMSVNEVLETNFTYHAPSENQVDRYKLLRDKAKELAYAIDERCPNSREKSLAMTNLEQAVMWANASIARQHKNSSASGS